MCAYGRCAVVMAIVVLSLDLGLAEKMTTPESEVVNTKLMSGSVVGTHIRVRPG